MLKTYKATTMAEALAEVKRDLGRDAVILHTRNVRKGGLLGLLGGRCVWEVTASPNVNVPSRIKGRYVSDEALDLSAGKTCFDVAMPSDETQAQVESASLSVLVQDAPEDTDQAERHSILGADETQDAEFDGIAEIIEDGEVACVEDVSPSIDEQSHHEQDAHATDSGEPSTAVDEDLTRGIQQMRDVLKALGQLPTIAPPTPPAAAETIATPQTMSFTVASPHHVPMSHPSMPGVMKAWPRELLEFHAHLLRQDVDEPVADELIHELAMSLAGVKADAKMIADRLCDLIAARIPTAGPVERKPSQARKPRVIALVGPTGVGKTTTIAKLAADLKLNKKQRVGLVTMDTYRIAAVDQLRVYAEIIEVPLRTVLSAGEMHQAIYGMDADVVLIDTAGRSQNDQPRLNELRAFLAAADADEVHLVISATASRRTAMTILNRFGPLGPNRLILTKLDEAETFGTILSFPAAGAAPFCFATTGQDVPDDIEPADPWRLAQRILKGN